MKRLLSWLGIQSKPPPDDDAEIDVSKELRRHRVRAYLARRQARHSERAFLRASDNLHREALGYQWTRAAEEALEFMERTRRHANK